MFSCKFQTKERFHLSPTLTFRFHLSILPACFIFIHFSLFLTSCTYSLSCLPHIVSIFAQKYWTAFSTRQDTHHHVCHYYYYYYWDQCEHWSDWWNISGLQSVLFSYYKMCTSHTTLTIVLWCYGWVHWLGPSAALIVCSLIPQTIDI